MWNKIVNPETGRKVNINGKIGSKILQKYVRLMRQSTMSGGWSENWLFGGSLTKDDSTPITSVFTDKVPLK